MSQPRRLVVVLGTGTEVGKTWVACRLLEHLRADGLTVAARKPAQSWDPDEVETGQPTDADRLAAATGDDPGAVCPAHRSYPVPLAPPMAAERLGRPPIALAELLAEVQWPAGVDVGVVEAAGGSRSPIAHDADGVDLARALQPDLVVLVADAGLGTIHAVRSAVAPLAEWPLAVLLNRYDPGSDLHRRNRAWLAERDRVPVYTDPGEVAALRGAPVPPEPLRTGP